AMRLAPAEGTADVAFGLGAILGQRGDALAAAELFRAAPLQRKEALAADPRHADANLGLGISYMEIGQIKNAVLSFRQSVQACPQNPIALYNLGVALEQYSQSCTEKDLKAVLAEGELALTAASAFDPDTADYLSQLGVVLLRSGKPVKAIEAFEKALRVDPTHEGAADNIRAFEAAHIADPSSESLDTALRAEAAYLRRPEAALEGNSSLELLLATGDDLEF
ncbi:unnamed protein product, partial [Polarella glacialis]